MTEDSNLPASLEKLEINPARPECCKMDVNRNLLVLNCEPQCTLQSLSLEAECTKGNCHCNRKKEKEVTVKRVSFKRPIVRRSKLNGVLLRSPVLRLRDNNNTNTPTTTTTTPPTNNNHHNHNGGLTVLLSSRDTGTTISSIPTPPPPHLTATSSTIPVTPATATATAPATTSNSNQTTQIKPLRLNGETCLCLGPEELGGGVGGEEGEGREWWCSEYSASGNGNGNTNTSASGLSSCAIEARSSPDDTTMDELASYFDLFVHIPKKMSFMAEMMYT